MTTNKLPPGVEITTPSGRRAKVLYYDSDDRVHVRYCGDAINPNEQGCFPGKLVEWKKQ
jgi:hypothetical protein